jgi:hypothetical protein
MPFSAGRPETLCGAGSTLANTVSVRTWLPCLFKELEISSLLDAPCGDFNWMAHTDLSGIDYFGFDYDREHLSLAVGRPSIPSAYAPKSKRFIELDIASDQLPRADMVLCREFLQHLPNEQVSRVIRNFRASGCKWFLATSHDNTVNTDITAAGMFRPLNLTKAPFNLPNPQRSIGDEPGSGRILGLWPRSDFE